MANLKSPGKGKKRCSNKNCNKIIAAASRTCPECGKVFSTDTTKKKAASKKGKGSGITADMVKLVAEISDKLQEDREITADSLLKEIGGVDLNEALSGNMSGAEMLRRVKEKEAAEKESELVRSVSKKELSIIIDTLKDL